MMNLKIILPLKLYIFFQLVQYFWQKFIVRSKKPKFSHLKNETI